MSQEHDKVISKMNEIRLCYIETNNRMCDSIDRLTSSYIKDNKKLQPQISLFTKELILKRLQHMRKTAVDYISYGLEKCIQRLNEPSDLSNISKTRRFPKKIIEALEESFNIDNYPSDYEKSRLARMYKLSLKQINNWFTNKRNRTKLTKNNG
ncbi:Homeobox protein HD-1 [Nosema bombycis CQ1]|uniref:Homeobox protein HD-1 n=1 Tax=Nosema bombycis (strain CQ1 / CVCC 102059) TaxID=578461 RepID=R0MHH2_NOSB1|nr:Homeobox protein HD-1 [Nosema bombycis CQ1]|eukprot:EOB12248.1 Homeobox protein HD-1 [Nosema bombycis CQ1]